MLWNDGIIWVAYKLYYRFSKLSSLAVVKWHVSIGETISRDELSGLNFEDFQTGNTGMLSRYTIAMQEVYKYYKRTYGTEKNTQYIFFIEYPDADKITIII